MKAISREEISRLIPKALLHDMQQNINNLKHAIKEANKFENHQVDSEDIETEIAFSLWAFAFETHWLQLNIKEKELKESLTYLSCESYSEFTGIPTQVVGRWIEQVEASYKLVESTGNPGLFALPIMIYLGYGDFKTLQTQLLFSFAALSYSNFVTGVSGYWKKAFNIYSIK